VLAAFDLFGERVGYSSGGRREGLSIKRGSMAGPLGNGGDVCYQGDAGSAARFFFSAKASGSERFESKHPTVKPVALMQWLCRLVCPRGGTVLDPFAGSGSTGMAALNEGMRALLIEREAEYVTDIRRRLGGGLWEAAE
jgi:site-specific DNA-methyltransferase (adenine-specific)